MACLKRGKPSFVTLGTATITPQRIHIRDATCIPVIKTGERTRPIAECTTWRNNGREVWQTAASPGGQRQEAADCHL